MRHGLHIPRPFPSLNRLRSRTSRRCLLTLAIETSCDDTAVAILEKQSRCDTHVRRAGAVSQGLPLATLHFNQRITARNAGHGGIHPIESLESHRAHLAKLVAQSCRFLPRVEVQDADHGMIVQSNDGVRRWKPDFVSVTRGPGMRSNVACGLDLAKGLSVAWDVPLLGVHHMQAHALTARLVSAMGAVEGEREGEMKVEPQFPFLTLLVSGGHTMLVNSTGLTSHRIIASTRDVAIGDTLDKCGRLLLPTAIKDGMADTAFAKHLSKYAFPDEQSFKEWHVPRTRGEEVEKPLNEYGWQIQTPLADTKELAFSFSGLASEVERIVRRQRSAEKDVSTEEQLMLSRTALATAFEHLGSRTVIALEELRRKGTNVSALVVSGGVAANDFLRYFLREMLNARGFNSVGLVFPPVDLCTDNAAMIAWCGMEMYEAGYRSDLSIDALRKWSMDASSVDGGILGINGWIQNRRSMKS